MSIQNDIDQLDVEIRIEQQRGALQDTVKITDLQAKRLELVSQADAEQLAQDKVVKLEGLAQLIADYDIFGALFPEEGYKEILGITTYAEKRQSLNQIVNAITTSIQTDVIDEYNSRLSAANDQNRAQIARAEDAESQLTEEQAKAVQAAAQYASELAQRDTEISNLKEQLLMKQERIDELKEELEQAPAPSSLKIDITPKPSQSLTDLLANTREQSNRSIKTAQELALEGTSYRGKVILGATGAPISTPTGGSESTDSFRDEATQADTQNGGVLTTGTVTPPPIGGTPFPGDLATGDTVVPEVVEQTEVTRAEFDELAARVARLEQGQVGAAA